MWTERRSGKTYQRSHHDHRDPYERDGTRVVHCPAFRRLQRKTQILGPQSGDFHRTRLTHSLEAASIGRSLTRYLRFKYQHQPEAIHLPSDDLITVICLLHDMGHPPFGHGGETALNQVMQGHGGFEGNAQTLRLITKLETSYGAFGLDLTRRTLLGILKYPTPWSRTEALTQTSQSLPPKAYFDCEEPEVDWILAPLSAASRTHFQSLNIAPQQHTHGQAAFHSLDCSIMDLADDIAYGVHDLEDAIHLKLMHRAHLDTALTHHLLKDTPLSTTLLNNLFSNAAPLQKQAVGELVNYFITTTAIGIEDNTFDEPLLRFQLKRQPEADRLLTHMKTSVFNIVINAPSARIVEHGGQMIILKLFEALSSNPKALLDEHYREHYNNAPNSAMAHRILCDYIANLTDFSARQLYEQLFGFQ